MENVTHEKKQPVENNYEIIQILELADKDSKAAIITVIIHIKGNI